MWYGNTSQNIRNLFIEIESNEPAIVMIDEIDAFLSRRTSLRDPSGDECHIRTVAQFLNYMDGLESNNKRIVILGATNRLDNLDPTATRAGRFSYMIHLGPPNKIELVSIWLIQMDIAQQRAERVPLFSPKINEAIFSDREPYHIDGRPQGHHRLRDGHRPGEQQQVPDNAALCPVPPHPA